MSTLVRNAHTPVDATAGPVTMTLPTASVVQGDEVSVEKYDATSNTVTITGSIRGVAAQTVALSLPKEIVGFRADSAGSWWPVFGHKTLASLSTVFSNIAATIPKGDPGIGFSAIPVEADQTYMVKFKDLFGRLLFTIDKANGGTTFKFHPSMILPGSQLDTTTQGRLLDPAAAGSFRAVPAEVDQTKLYRIKTLFGQLLSYYDSTDGAFVPSKIRLPAAVVDYAQVATSLLGGLMQPLATETGKLWRIKDGSGHALMWIRQSDGALCAARADLPIYTSRDADSTTYLAHPFKDAAGRNQVAVIKKSSGAATIKTSSTTVDTVEPTFSADGTKLLYRDNSTGTMHGYYRPADGTGTPYLAVPSLADTMYGWGDSILYGAGSGGDGGFMSRLATLLGTPISNQGINGQNVRNVGARANVTPVLLTVTGNQIPASGPVTITASTVGGVQTEPYSSNILSGKGALAGVHGTYADDGTGPPGVQTFTRDAPGSAVTCPPGTPWVSDLGIAARDKINLFEIGRHDFELESASALVTSMQAFPAALTSYVKRYLMLGIFIDSTETPGTTNRTSLDAANAAIAAAFPDQYVDVNAYLQSSQAFIDAGVTQTSQDTTDIGNGINPTSFRFDTLHPNAAGNTALALFLQRTLVAKGWI